MNLWDKCTLYQKKIGEYCDKIKQTQASPELIKELYLFVKKVVPEFYIEGFMHPRYSYLLTTLFFCEMRIPKEFIIESKPNFNIQKFKNLKECSSSKDIIEYIVYETRKALALKHSLNKNNPVNLDIFSLENDCEFSSEKAKEICDSLNIESYILEIYPGYSESAKLCNGNGFHMCNIIKLNNQYYLIDCTYRQFFTLNQNYLDRIGIVDTSGCRPGRFMLMNDERKQIASTILKDGWIALDNNTLKHFLDGFTISFRNGLYYENTRDFTYTTPYTIEDYINFLQGNDNQINREGLENLGYQKKPLKNWNLSFKRR